MERRLYAFTAMNAVIAVGCGIGMLVLSPDLLHQRWLQAKLALVVLLIGFQHVCGAHLRRFRDDAPRHSSGWYRLFNEVPTILLFGIVALVVVGHLIWI